MRRAAKRSRPSERDARALCEAGRLGAYRKAHRSSDRQRHIRAERAVRETMVTTRAKYIVLIKSLFSREGWRLMGGSSESFVERVKLLQLSPELQSEIEPLPILLKALNEQIKAADRKLEELVETDETVKRLTSVPGVGKVTATAFVAAIDEIQRFADAKQVSSYFGLVPREFSSGEKQLRGHISKTGSRRIRSLLVEVGWGIINRESHALTKSLRDWAMKIAERRGKKIAAVALARKLAGILYPRCRDQTEFSRKSNKGESLQMRLAA